MRKLTFQADRLRRTTLTVCSLVLSTIAMAQAPPATTALAQAPPAARPLPTSDDEFCLRAQRTMAGTSMTSKNVVHTTYESFKKSKATIKPLQTEQFVVYEDDRRTRPLRISCKLKSADLFVITYGPQAAREPDLSCIDLNRQTVAAVYASFTPADRVALDRDRVIFEDDESTFMGSSWIKPYPFVWSTDDGMLHLGAKSLRVDWNNLWFSWAPDRVRGVVYCHLIAPEYLRRLVLGEKVVEVSE